MTNQDKVNDTLLWFVGGMLGVMIIGAIQW